MIKKNQKYEKLQELRDTIQQQDFKLTQLVQHNEKLTKQCQTFNEMKLKYEEMFKENEFMRSKIRFMEINSGMQTSGSSVLGRMPSTTTQMNKACLGTEDEEGEEFSNTFLIDLKNGDSEISLAAYSTSELQKRNSMYPQHMRSSYLMHNLDRTVGEQEMKVRKKFIIETNNNELFQDGGTILDDSHTVLLHNGVNRKKQRGTTQYNRPGPPTPSKMGGRLSMGGASSDVNYTHVLKDATNNNEAAAKKTPNPSRFRNIFSSSSKLKHDEVSMNQ